MKEFKARLEIAKRDKIDSAIIELALENGQVTKGGIVQKTKKKGKGRTVYSHLSALVEEGILGVVKRHSVNFYFLTDEAEEALIKLSEEKFGSLFNKLNDIVFFQNYAGGKEPRKLIEVNNAAVEILGYKKKELLKMTPADFSVELSREEFARTQKELKKKKHAVFERQAITKEGKIIPLEVSTRLVTWRGEKILVSISRDITKRKEAEKASKVGSPSEVDR